MRIQRKSSNIIHSTTNNMITLEQAYAHHGNITYENQRNHMNIILHKNIRIFLLVIPWNCSQTIIIGATCSQSHCTCCTSHLLAFCFAPNDALVFFGIAHKLDLQNVHPICCPFLAIARTVCACPP